MKPTLSDPVDENIEPTTLPTATTVQVENAAAASSHPDPITGEPNAHPVEVGVGALGAGAAGAAIGAILGPVGVVAGAVIGSVVGAIVGKEVASTSETSEAPMSDIGDATSTEPGQPASAAALDVPPPVPRHQPDDELLAATRPNLPSATETRADSVDITSSPLIPADSEMESRPFVLDESLDRQPTDIAPTSPTDIPASPVDAALDSPTRPVNTGGVSDEALRMAAYYRYLDRQTTGTPGDEASDWEHAKKSAGE